MCRNTYLKNERGSALVMVMIIVMMMSGALISLLYRMRLEQALTYNQRERLAFQRLAVDLLKREFKLFMEDDNEYDTMEEPWATMDDGKLLGAQETDQFTGDVKVEFKVIDECAKMNLNSMTYMQSVALLEEGQYFQPLLDWRDTNHEVFPDGAEADYYKQKGYVPPDFNGLFTGYHFLETIRWGEKFPDDFKDYATVYGYLNPNYIDGATFGACLADIGLEGYVIERLEKEFTNFQNSGNYFTKLEDFSKLPSMHLGIWPKLENRFTFGAVYNINTIHDKAMRALWHGEDNPERFQQFLNEKKERVFTKQEEVDEFMYRYVPVNILEEVERNRQSGGTAVIKLGDSFTIMIKNGTIKIYNQLGVKSNFFTLVLKVWREKGPVVTLTTTIERYKELNERSYRIRIYAWRIEEERDE